MQSGSNREGLGLVLEGLNAILTLVCILIPFFVVVGSLVPYLTFILIDGLLVEFLQSLGFLSILITKVVVAIIYRLVVPRGWSLWDAFRLTAQE